MTFSGWYQFKLFLEHTSGISMDLLHVLVGLAIFAITARLLRRDFASSVPWLLLLILELANEVYDLNVELWPNRASQFGEGAKDIVLTMALPTILHLRARWKRRALSGNAERNDFQSTTK